MAGPLLYRPPPRWQTWAAFGGALAIHFAAIGIAAIKPQEKVMDLTDIPEATVEVSLDPQPEPPQPTPPPEEEPPPPPPPEAIPEEKPEFVEEKPTPPPKRPPTNAPVQPIAKLSGGNGNFWGMVRFAPNGADQIVYLQERVGNGAWQNMGNPIQVTNAVGFWTAQRPAQAGQSWRAVWVSPDFASALPSREIKLK